MSGPLIITICVDDRDEVERLRKTFTRYAVAPMSVWSTGDLEDALREFAMPEPTVTDAEARAMRKALDRLDHLDGKMTRRFT